MLRRLGLDCFSSSQQSFTTSIQVILYTQQSQLSSPERIFQSTISLDIILSSHSSNPPSKHSNHHQPNSRTHHYLPIPSDATTPPVSPYTDYHQSPHTTMSSSSSYQPKAYTSRPSTSSTSMSPLICLPPHDSPLTPTQHTLPPQHPVSTHNPTTRCAASDTAANHLSSTMEAGSRMIQIRAAVRQMEGIINRLSRAEVW